MNVMQKGFATLEIALVVFIIAVLVSAALPNAARVLDRVSLDYEIKRLYTEMRFLQSYDRMAFMNDTHFKLETDPPNNPIILELNETNCRIETRDPQKTYEQYFLPEGFKLSYPKNMDFKRIKFDDMGKPKSPSSDNILNGHFVITSRLGKELYFIFDTVGRFRGSRTKTES